MQNQSCFGGRLIVAPLVHLLLIPSTPMHLKLINNPLCYLTDYIIIREVQLKSCHTLIKKCSFNFFEQCIFAHSFKTWEVAAAGSSSSDDEETSKLIHCFSKRPFRFLMHDSQILRRQWRAGIDHLRWVPHYPSLSPVYHPTRIPRHQHCFHPLDRGLKQPSAELSVSISSFRTLSLCLAEPLKTSLWWWDRGT